MPCNYTDMDGPALCTGWNQRLCSAASLDFMLVVGSYACAAQAVITRTERSLGWSFDWKKALMRLAFTNQNNSRILGPGGVLVDPVWSGLDLGSQNKLGSPIRPKPQSNIPDTVLERSQTK